MDINNKQCETCYYYRIFGDESYNLPKVCTYELEPDYDEEGFIIDAPPCERD